MNDTTRLSSVVSELWQGCNQQGTLARDSVTLVIILADIATVTFNTNQLLTMLHVCVSCASVLVLQPCLLFPAEGEQQMDLRPPPHISYMSVSDQDVNYNVLFSN